MEPDPGQTNEPQPSQGTQEPANDFLIVGIGASAGGVDAFEKLFTNIPPGLGLGFVVIQHLGKQQKSILPEIVQRFTP